MIDAVATIVFVDVASSVVVLKTVSRGVEVGKNEKVSSALLRTE